MTIRRWVKKLPVKLANELGLTERHMHRLDHRMPYIRTLNYHWTAEEDADALESHLRYFRERFENINRPRLDAFFEGRLKLEHPGLILCFDDGAKNNREVAAPLLERYGMTGWFFVIAGGADPELSEVCGGAYKRFCMSWEEIADLAARGHEIGCHTYSHRNVADLREDELERELIHPKDQIQRHTGANVVSFCYPLGTSASYSRESLDLLRRHYRYVFNSCPAPVTPGDSPHGIGRNGVAAEQDLETIRFVASGLADSRHFLRRRRYRRLLV